jgi:DNA-directed RNA polymerase specialized sigma24 family protein
VNTERQRLTTTAKAFVPETTAALRLQGEFTTTHWSLVLGAADHSSPRSEAALERLCKLYWYPLYAYVRRSGHTAEDAQDLTQNFFARLLSKDYLRLADSQRGRFRTFLLTSLQRFLVNDWKKAGAQKRGGGRRAVSLDMDASEQMYQIEPPDTATPESIFEKRWALAVLETVMVHLGEEFNASGKGGQFEALKDLLWGEKTSRPYSVVAGELGMTEGALKVAVHRLRHRFRELLRAEVAQTVASAEDVDEELRHLISVISG